MIATEETATATKFKVKFKFQQETKGAIRFGEVLPNGNIASAPNDPGAIIGTLYMLKSAFPGTESYPKEIEVSIV